MSDGNCRHVWHSTESKKDISEKLYDAINAGIVSLEVQRIKFNHMLKKYI